MEKKYLEKYDLVKAYNDFYGIGTRVDGVRYVSSNLNGSQVNKMFKCMEECLESHSINGKDEKEFIGFFIEIMETTDLNSLWKYNKCEYGVKEYHKIIETILNKTKKVSYRLTSIFDNKVVCALLNSEVGTSMGMQIRQTPEDNINFLTDTSYFKNMSSKKKQELAFKAIINYRYKLKTSDNLTEICKKYKLIDGILDKISEEKLNYLIEKKVALFPSFVQQRTKIKEDSAIPYKVFACEVRYILEQPNCRALLQKLDKGNHSNTDDFRNFKNEFDIFLSHLVESKFYTSKLHKNEHTITKMLLKIREDLKIINVPDTVIKEMVETSIFKEKVFNKLLNNMVVEEQEKGTIVFTNKKKLKL